MAKAYFLVFGAGSSFGFFSFLINESKRVENNFCITIFPNPAKDHVTFALDNREQHRNIELRCFNQLRMQLHHTKIISGQQQVSTDVSNWPPGLYIAVVLSDGKPVGRGKFVVQR